MNRTGLIILLVLATSCSSKKIVSQTTKDSVKKAPIATVKTPQEKAKIAREIILQDNKSIYYYSSTITSEDLKKHLLKLTSKEFEGRKTGEKGQKIAAKYLADYYKSIELEAAISEGKYFQTIPKEYFKGKSKDTSENVLAFIYGTEKPEEVVVISAHYDHLGVKKGNLETKSEEIFNGADDNGSGTSALLEIAEAFQKAVIEGEGPKRSVLFLNLTGEEEGLYGSKYYTSHPVFPLKNTVVNLNIDMIGRVDKRHEDNPNFVYLIGSDKLSQELHFISEAINKKYTQLELDYKYNDTKDPNRYYYRSDHYNFAKNGIPIIFYFNGIHKDYHKETDTEDKINYEILTKRAQLVFLTAWEIANREERVKID